MENEMKDTQKGKGKRKETTETKRTPKRKRKRKRGDFIQNTKEIQRKSGARSAPDLFCILFENKVKTKTETTTGYFM